jgi:murein DD-endopeptidase MepM/ murein hydrolase activator NlpD
MLMLSCETDYRILETEQHDALNFKTVTKSEAQRIFGHFQQKREMELAKSKAKDSLYLEITPDWNTFHQEDLDLDEATLSAVDITTNSKLDVESRLTFIEINASLLNVIESRQISSRVDGEMDSSYIYYHNLDGKFIVGYKMEQGAITSRLTKRIQSKSKTEKAFNYAKKPCEEEFDLFASSPCYGHLEEVIITTTVRKPHTMFIVEMSSEYFLDFGGWGGDISDAGGGGGGNSGDIIEPKKPCPGDPVPNPKIVSSGASGKQGGTFGCTRQGGDNCQPPFDKRHDGMDIEAIPGSNTFAMYSGRVTNIRNTFSPGQYLRNSYGNYVIIRFVSGSNTFSLKYNHLNQVDVEEGQSVNTGDVIGTAGNTGNAASSGVTPHIHLQVFNSSWESIDPSDFLTTKFDNNYNPISNCQ